MHNFIAAVEWIDTKLPEIIAAIPEGERGKFKGCVERISLGSSSSHSTTTNSSRTFTTSYLSALTLGFDSKNSDDAAPPTICRKSRYNPMIELNFDDDLVFPALPIVAAKPRPPSTVPITYPIHKISIVLDNYERNQRCVLRNSDQV
jgi:hypothetical protein